MLNQERISLRKYEVKILGISTTTAAIGYQKKPFI